MKHGNHALISHHHHPLPPNTPRRLPTRKQHLGHHNRMVRLQPLERILNPVPLPRLRRHHIRHHLHRFLASRRKTPRRRRRRHTRLPLLDPRPPPRVFFLHHKRHFERTFAGAGATFVVGFGPLFEPLQVPEVDFAAFVADDEQRVLEGAVEEREPDVEAGCFLAFEFEEALVAVSESGAGRSEGVGCGGRGGGRWGGGGGEAFDAPEDDFVGVGAFGEDEIVVPCYAVG